MNIIPTNNAEHLATNLEKKFKVSYTGENKDGKKQFPDGEIYTRIKDFNEIPASEKSIILHSGQPNPNDGLVELENILDLVEKRPAYKDIFFTYFPYGMQDKEFEYGEPNVARNLLLRFKKNYNVDKIYTIDAHFWSKEWTNYPPLSATLKNISAVSLLKEKAEEKYRDVFYMTPDEGAEKRTGISGTDKERSNSYEVEIKSDKNFKEKIEGRVVGVIDDLVETGGTMSKTYDFCKDHGADKVLALITHGVLPKGISRLKEKYDDLLLTNTIDRPEANVDVTDLITKTLK